MPSIGRRLRQVDALECGASAQPCEIAVFDFLSYDHVHLPFNEAYLRVLRAAYPLDRISFHAAKGHIERLAARLTDLANIRFLPCKPFGTPFGLSHHNPLAGRWAARQCLNIIALETAGRPIRPRTGLRSAGPGPTRHRSNCSRASLICIGFGLEITESSIR